MRRPGYEITLALQTSLLRCGVEAHEDMQHALLELFANAKCRGSAFLRGETGGRRAERLHLGLAWVSGIRRVVDRLCRPKKEFPLKVKYCWTPSSSLYSRDTYPSMEVGMG